MPDQEQTLRWLQEVRGADVADSRPFEEWVKDPAVQKAVYDDMQQVGKVQGLKGFELARKIHLHSEQFTVENGLLTPTFKLKRHYAQEVSDFHVREVGDIDTTTGICRGICGTASKRLVSDLRLLGNMKAENTAQKWLTVLLDVRRPPQEPSAGVRIWLLLVSAWKALCTSQGEYVCSAMPVLICAKQPLVHAEL